MNPQYIPQQYGAQNFQNTRPSPTVTPQGFQNVPLGPPKMGGPISNGPPTVGGHPFGAVNQSSASNQFGPPQPNIRPPHIPNNQNPLPAGQLPPGHFPSGQLPPGQLPSGQLPPGQLPPGQLPPGKLPLGQLPLGQLPPSQLPPGQLPTGQLHPGQLAPGQVPPSHLPSRQIPPGSFPSAQSPPGQLPAGQQTPPRQVPPGFTQKLVNPDVSSPDNHFGNRQNQNGPAPFPPTSNSDGTPGNQIPTNQFGQKSNLPPTSSSVNANQYSSQFGPPKPSQNPLSPNANTDFPPSGPANQFPAPNPNGPPQFGAHLPPRQPQGQPNQFQHSGQPPMPGVQSPLNQNYSNTLTNQMQNMNMNQGPYYNDNGPHMPPPLGQQNYVNGSHMKQGYPPMPSQQNLGRPPMPGHPMQPPMPGQSPMPGQPLMPGQPPMQGQPPMPGQAPMPGMQPAMPGMQPAMPSGPYAQSPYGQPQQQRRLDPDQMPSPIQVMQDDQRTRSGVFVTNQKGLVPPLITTNFEVQDQGNASPRYIRSTMYNVPITQELLKQTSVPFGLIISPMARTVGQEYPPPIVNFGDLGPVRCVRCKAYMCPFMQFIDAGRRFQCLFCKATTDVPTEYFQHLDHTGQRADRFERPELVLGTYEFTATQDYCRNNKLPKPPAIIFVIDVSYNNIKSGLVNLLCAQMKEVIQNLPVDQDQEKSNMRVGFITYNSAVHFYNIKGTLAAPQMMVVGDVHDMFMPLLDGFLCTPEESEVVIDALMEQIPAMFGDTRETETILLPAILAGLEALKASECTGKLLVFHSTLPIADAPGKLKNRDDRKLLGTDKERTVLTPQTQAYNQLGQECVAAGCAVDLFLFNNAYIDIATIGQVSRLTGGEIFKYTYFQADIDGQRLIEDIITDISRPVAFDSIMRVRTSTGIRATEFYGHFFMSNTTDMEIAAIDCDKAVAIEIKHDDKLTEEEGVYVQVALLYTSCSGQRRLRVMNLSLRTCSQMADLYRCCELDTIVNFFAKQSVFKLLEHSPKAIKDNIVARAAQMLANYRKNCATPSSAGQLILPECMKLLPLYVNCLLKSDAMSGGSDIAIDDRSFVMHAVMVMDIPTSVAYFYPRLIPIVDVKPSIDGKVDIPPPVRTTVEKISDQGVYILENGIHMFLYIGLAANPDFLQQVFGVPTAVQVDVDKCELPPLDNPLAITIRSLIDQIRVQRHRYMRLTLVRQREKLEPVFKHFLVEDRGTDGSASYVDFLCHMHKEIRTILS